MNGRADKPIRWAGKRCEEPMGTRTSGFTLVELMITVAVLGILGLVAAPNLLNFIPKHRVDGAAKAMAAEMQLTRMRAVSTNRIHHVTFDAAAQQVKVEDEDSSGTRHLIKTVDFATSFPNVSLDYNAVTNIEGTGAISKPAAFGAAASTEATFLPNGLLRDSGSFYLIPTADKGKRNDRMRGVQVGMAGIVSLYRHKAAASPPWEVF